MTQKHQSNRSYRWVSLTEYREEVFGPIQSQLLLASVFFLPFVIRLAFIAGLPRPESLILRSLVMVVSLLLLFAVYIGVCRIAGVPAVVGKQSPKEMKHP